MTELRRLRQDAGLGPREPLEVAVEGGSDAVALRVQADLLAGLGHATLVAAAGGGVPVTVGDARATVGGGRLAEAVVGKLERRLVEAAAERGKAEAMLANPAFVTRAPAERVVEVRERVARSGAEADALAARIDELRGTTDRG